LKEVGCMGSGVDEEGIEREIRAGQE